ncbi:MAG: DEAD/DEAH box helicase [Caldilineaceae bacterium]
MRPCPARCTAAARLWRRGITRLYSHQADAIGAALAGQDVVVVTPTASGKTLCYNGPVLNSLLRDPAGRALYLFPTKALAQDQLAELNGLLAAIDATGAGDEPLDLPQVATYDGDTPSAARQPGAARPAHPQQPGHAPRRHPALSHQLERLLRRAALRCHRRDARLPRRLRQPHGQRAAAAAADLRLYGSSPVRP